MHCLKCGHHMVKIQTYCPKCKWDQRKDYEPELSVNEEKTSTESSVVLNMDEKLVENDKNNSDKSLSLEEALEEAIKKILSQYEDKLPNNKDFVVSINSINKETEDSNEVSDSHQDLKIEDTLEVNSKIQHEHTNIKDVEQPSNSSTVAFDVPHQKKSFIKNIGKSTEYQLDKQSDQVKTSSTINFGSKTIKHSFIKGIKKADTSDKNILVKKHTTGSKTKLELSSLISKDEYRKLYASDYAYRYLSIITLILAIFGLYFVVTYPYDFSSVNYNFRLYGLIYDVITNNYSLDGISSIDTANANIIYYLIGLVSIQIILSIIQIITVSLKKKNNVITLLFAAIVLGFSIFLNTQPVELAIHIKGRPFNISMVNIITTSIIIGSMITIFSLLGLVTKKKYTKNPKNLYKGFNALQLKEIRSNLSLKILLIIMVIAIYIVYIFMTPVTLESGITVGDLVGNFLGIYYGILFLLLFILVPYLFVLLYTFLELSKEIKGNFLFEIIRFILIIGSIGLLPILSIELVERKRYKFAKRFKHQTE